jgi:hypothetical protein
MKRTPLRRRARLRAKTSLRRPKPLTRSASMGATERQRANRQDRPARLHCGRNRLRIAASWRMAGATASETGRRRMVGMIRSQEQIKGIRAR